MIKRLLPLALTAALLCPPAAFAQTPSIAPATPSDPAPAAAPMKKHNHVAGKISAVDAVAKTITLTHGKKTVVLSVPAAAKIYKISDPKGQPTGTFSDLTVDTPVNASTDGSEEAPTAKSVHIRAPKTTPAQ